MRIDDKNKVAVPDFVAEYIEYAKKKGFDCQLAFVEIPEHDEWLPKNIYRWLYDNSQKENDNRFFNCIKAWFQGYEVTETKYYWRKKKEHIVKIEHFIWLTYNTISKELYLERDNQEDTFNKTEFTSQEARDLLKDDFDKFEKVEINNV